MRKLMAEGIRSSLVEEKIDFIRNPCCNAGNAKHARNADGYFRRAATGLPGEFVTYADQKLFLITLNKFED
jgi:hypothetical protein